MSIININGQDYEQITPNLDPIWNRTMIVGTITITDGINRGFYYTSPHNKLWKLTDYALNIQNKTPNFQQYSKALNENYKNYLDSKIDKKKFDKERAKIVKKFKNLLDHYKLGILNIFSSAHFKRKNEKTSTEDKDIYGIDINTTGDKYLPKIDSIDELFKQVKQKTIKRILLNCDIKYFNHALNRYVKEKNIPQNDTDLKDIIEITEKITAPGNRITDSCNQQIWRYIFNQDIKLEI